MDGRRTPRFARARTVARAAIEVDEALGPGVVSSAVLILFVAIFIPVGLVALFTSMILFGAIGSLLGLASSPIAGPLGLAWFGGSLVIVFVVFVKLYRRLPRRLLEIADDPASIVGGDASDAGQVRPQPTAPTPSLAELDAGLAPPPEHGVEGRGAV